MTQKCNYEINITPKHYGPFKHGSNIDFEINLINSTQICGPDLNLEIYDNDNKYITKEVIHYAPSNSSINWHISIPVLPEFIKNGYITFNFNFSPLQQNFNLSIINKNSLQYSFKILDYADSQKLSTAKKIENDEDNFNYIVDGNMDFYKVKFNKSGNTNFYLEPLILSKKIDPDRAADLNLCLYIYTDDGKFFTSQNSGLGKYNLINFKVNANQTYYIGVFPYGHVYSNGRIPLRGYLVRCRLLDQQTGNDGLIINNNPSYPNSQSRKTTPHYINTSDKRSPELYNKIIKQFDVENTKRYEKIKYVRNNKTYHKTFCNIFMWDVTTAMSAEVPHWISNFEINANKIYEIFFKKLSKATQDKIIEIAKWNSNSRPENKKGQYGNNFESWEFNGESSAFDYYFVTPKDAQKLANKGYPVVALWKNLKSGSGHVAMVVPQKSQDKYEITDYTKMKNHMKIAQAGGNNYEYTKFVNGFCSDEKYLDVLFFAHK